MTIFDYLKKNCEVAIYTDEYGNVYMETKEREYEKIISGAILAIKQTMILSG